jgi:hypothetical protein
LYLLAMKTLGAMWKDLNDDDDKEEYITLAGVAL